MATGSLALQGLSLRPSKSHVLEGVAYCACRDVDLEVRGGEGVWCVGDCSTV